MKVSSMMKTALLSAVLMAGALTHAYAADHSMGDKARYSVSSKKVSIETGKTANTSLAVKVAKGWKWNVQYPAKLTFKKVPAILKLDKSKYQQRKGDFKSTKQKASVAVKVTGATPGKATVQGVFKFSVCIETTCVMESAKIKLSVEVVAAR